MPIKTWGTLLLLATVSLLGSQEAVELEKSEEVAFATLPSAVRVAAEAALGTAELEAELEVEDGITLYTVKSHLEGGELNLTFSETGDLIESERSIDFSDLPDAVKQELNAAFPSQSFDEIERVERHLFELEFRADGREYEVSVSPAGRIQEVRREDEN